MNLVLYIVIVLKNQRTCSYPYPWFKKSKNLLQDYRFFVGSLRRRRCEISRASGRWWGQVSSLYFMSQKPLVLWGLNNENPRFFDSEFLKTGTGGSLIQFFSKNTGTWGTREIKWPPNTGMMEEKQQSSIWNKIFVSKCLLKAPMRKVIFQILENSNEFWSQLWDV